MRKGASATRRDGNGEQERVFVVWRIYVAPKQVKGNAWSQINSRFGVERSAEPGSGEQVLVVEAVRGGVVVVREGCACATRNLLGD